MKHIFLIELQRNDRKIWEFCQVTTQGFLIRIVMHGYIT